MLRSPARNLSALSIVGALALGVLTPSAGAATARVGAACKTSGAKSGTLVCTRKAGKLVWAKAATVTTTRASLATTTTVAAAASGAAAASNAANTGISGAWKVTNASTVGYRVKEVLNGQSIEGVGRTNGVTGTMTIADTTVNTVEMTVDLTTLKSDESRRDNQVQGRILQTSAFPTAKLKLGAPIALGGVPADKEEVSKTAKIALTLKSVTKTIDVPIKARRDGNTIQVNGEIPITFADYGIENPSLPPFVTTEDRGLIEFLVVFGR